ncbi:hypothetical protein MHYP_G00119250 [Metynnis hypsauchen]
MTFNSKRRDKGQPLTLNLGMGLKVFSTLRVALLYLSQLFLSGLAACSRALLWVHSAGMRQESLDQVRDPSAPFGSPHTLNQQHNWVGASAKMLTN